MTDDLHYLSLHEAAACIADRSLSPVTLVDACIARCTALQPTHHAFITLTFEAARAAARVAQQEIAAGRYRGPLHGIPIAHKDILLTAGVRTTAHSRLLQDWVPDRDAVAVQLLDQAGAISLGKTACHEFAFGTPDVDEPFPAARNPWNTAHMPGSSSSGSGVAVAAGMVMAATGTDTGGSVRHPAAACGIVGMKPTYGRVSLEGVIPLAPSLDHVGPLTRTVRDNALMLQALAGQGAPDFSVRLGSPVRGMRIGVPGRFIATVDHTAEVSAAFDRALALLQDLGVALVNIDPEGLDAAFDAANLIIAYEAAQYHHDDLQRQPEKFGPALRQRLMRGAALSDADYAAARARAAELKQTYAALFADGLDAIASPGREAPAETMEQLYANPAGKRGITNRIYSLTGSPAITLSMGFSATGLPLAIQLAAAHGAEPLLYQLADAYECSAGWSKLHP
ncbi:MAG: amidase [Comamonadaceae bacterium]|nr:MAG: amidase [Comamonadaceae bacterium]